MLGHVGHLVVEGHLTGMGRVECGMGRAGMVRAGTGWDGTGPSRRSEVGNVGDRAGTEGRGQHFFDMVKFIWSSHCDIIKFYQISTIIQYRNIEKNGFRKSTFAKK